MTTEFLAEFEIHHDAVVATVIDRDDLHGHVWEGEGPCVHDAVAAALHQSQVSFASERDERDACVAAMRSLRLSFRLHPGGQLESLGFA